MYTDRKAPKEIRGQAQSMLVFFTQGVGMFVGFKVAAMLLAPAKPTTDALAAAITAARGEETLSFAKQLAKMFAVELPEGLDPKLLETAAGLWKSYWFTPACMAGAVAVLFFLAFRDRSADQTGDEDPGSHN
jgi:hypothetical protein